LGDVWPQILDQALWFFFSPRPRGCFANGAQITYGDSGAKPDIRVPAHSFGLLEAKWREGGGVLGPRST
jgi:hypothetical protein